MCLLRPTIRPDCALPSRARLTPASVGIRSSRKPKPWLRGMCAAAFDANGLAMSASQHTSSPLTEGTRTSGGGPPTPPLREEDGTPSRKPSHLSLYCALAGGVLIVLAVVSAGTGWFGPSAAIVGLVLFCIAFYLHMPAADSQSSSDHAPRMLDDAPRRSEAARREADGHHSADGHLFSDDGSGDMT